MGQSDATFRHHLDEVTEAQFKCDVPSHTQNDDLLVKVPTLEQILCRGRFRHPGSYRRIPSLSTVCTRTLSGSWSGHILNDLTGVTTFQTPSKYGSFENVYAMRYFFRSIMPSNARLPTPIMPQVEGSGTGLTAMLFARIGLVSGAANLLRTESSSRWRHMLYP